MFSFFVMAALPLMTATALHRTASFSGIKFVRTLYEIFFAVKFIIRYTGYRCLTGSASDHLLILVFNINLIYVYYRSRNK